MFGELVGRFGRGAEENLFQIAQEGGKSGSVRAQVQGVAGRFLCVPQWPDDEETAKSDLHFHREQTQTPHPGQQQVVVRHLPLLAGERDPAVLDVAYLHGGALGACLDADEVRDADAVHLARPRILPLQHRGQYEHGLGEVMRFPGICR